MKPIRVIVADATLMARGLLTLELKRTELLHAIPIFLDIRCGRR